MLIYSTKQRFEWKTAVNIYEKRRLFHQFTI